MKVVARTFIKNEQLALPDHSSRQRNNLSLADGQIAPTTSHGTIERDHTLVAFILYREETGGTEGGVQRRVVKLVEWIEVTTEGAAQELRLKRMSASRMSEWRREENTRTI